MGLFNKLFKKNKDKDSNKSNPLSDEDSLNKEDVSFDSLDDEDSLNKEDVSFDSLDDGNDSFDDSDSLLDDDGSFGIKDSLDAENSSIGSNIGPFNSEENSSNENDSKSYDFKYFDNLIHNGTKEIELDGNIFLDYGEEFDYNNGIEIDIDDLIIDGNGHSIDVGGKVPIIRINGKNIVFKNLTFKNAFSDDVGAAVVNNGECSFENCSFLNNKSNIVGGAIINSKFSKMRISRCNFTNSSSRDGGAIVSAPNSFISIENTSFINNSSTNFGGAILSQGEMAISNCRFENNESIIGGAIVVTNTGEMKIKDSTFDNNISNNSGGAIFNSANMTLENSIFKNNQAHTGGAIHNSLGSDLDCIKTDFIANISSDGSSICNENILKISKCKFRNHNGDTGILINKSSLKIFDSRFEDNRSRSVIYNDSDSSAYISGGHIINNSTILSSIYNIGKYSSVSGTFFENNISQMEFADDIYNETELSLEKPKFSSNNRTILNKGTIEIRKFKKYLEEKIQNTGNIETISHDSSEFEGIAQDSGSSGSISHDDAIPHSSTDFNLMSKNSSYIEDSNENRLDFSSLENEIANCNKHLILKADVFLNSNEIDFYEGGIELDIDGLVIDGGGNSIDGGGKSRIFHVTGKDIVLKNIIFKNGQLKNSYDEDSNGGGAIRTVFSSSLKLENCQFIENEAEGSGGAILNNGQTDSLNCTYSNNSSTSYGGAVCNKGKFTSQEDILEKNKSRLAGGIYNLNRLEIDGITSFDNSSNISQDIFNNYHIEMKNISSSASDLVYDACKFKSSPTSSSFKDLNDRIRNSTSLELRENVVFDFKRDFEFKNGIEIDLDEDMIIDGNGYSIDAGNDAAFFSIKQSSKSLVFKNITFINGFSNEKPIFSNEGKVIFENCRFIKNRSAGSSPFILNNGFLKLSDSFFSQNSANTSIINTVNEIEIFNTVFLNNWIKSYGVLFNNGELKLEKSKFESNVILGDGAVIHNLGRKKEEIKETDSSVDKLITAIGSPIEISENSFINNFSRGLGSIILNFSSLTLMNSDFINNSSKTAGACIMNQNRQFTVESCRFINNSTDETGGAIYNVGTFFIINSIFKNNSSGSDGGSLYNRGKVEIEDSIFEDNNAKEAGGAINNLNSLKVDSSQFLSNSSDFGGAISNYHTIEIKNSEFKGNFSEDGGAINNQQGEIEIRNNRFIENSSKCISGAIHNHGKIEIWDSELIGNSCEQSCGAISNQKDASLNVFKCKFIENSAVFAGAIGNFSQLDIEESSFRHNHSQKYGGAINNQENSMLRVLNSEFDLNKSGLGGAIFNSGQTIVTDSRFSENSVDQYGGVFFNGSDGSLKVNDSKCVRNKAKNGSILFTMDLDSFEFEDCSFENNDLELVATLKK